jgi:hypothetical protein
MSGDRTFTTCSHCHAENEVEVISCWRCGHDAHVPRIRCQCPQCIGYEQLPNYGELNMPR